ncbi:extracellular solute-binding protein [Paenibacillus nanensis]|uniref:Extracellular solute-binding protein n=1 Tax=Paenibacillus nanensis TaxID=393251 RepID=A0A3A1UY57_9BACL|nr:extracellular solute-binding protein [Paenibacillus nanensis]RIX53155.1 extracellular solute-binding protein [Paenibacillus nanensis]
MRNIGKRRYLYSAILLLAVIIPILAFGLGFSSAGSSSLDGPYETVLELEGFREWADRSIAEAELEPYYADVLLDEYASIPHASSRIAVEASAPAARSDESALRKGAYGGRDNVLVWDSMDTHWAEYKVTVPEDGLYEMHATYLPLKGEDNTRPVVWDVKIDGARPFREASSITLYRQWKDAGDMKKNDDGDEIRPVAADISDWQTHPLVDSGANYAEPFKWHFTKGTHTIRVEGYEPVAIAELALEPPQELPTYLEAKSSYPSSESPDADDILIQAEQMTWKNDPSVVMMWDRDWRSVPRAEGRITYNTMGGVRWDWPNQEAAWEFEAPESGLYKIGLRALQNRFSQKASFRTIKIDGKVPFRELLTYRFPYGSTWQSVVLSDGSGEPFDIYLEKGKHTLSISLTHASVSPIVRGIENLSALLRDIDTDLNALTSGQVDRNRTWKIDRDLPGLKGQLEQAAHNLDVLADAMTEVNGRKDSASEGFRSSAGDLRALLEIPDDIPYHVDEIASITEKINNFVVNLHKQPLQLDEIYIAPADGEFPDMLASWGEQAVGIAANFFYSFNTRQSLGELDDNELNVWVLRGRDYVTQLQDLADETFTPVTGIKVKVNLLPNPELLVMSNAAGLQPDVALGLNQDLPVDYAIRGSVYDLSRFGDFKEVYDKFSPGSWQALYYDKGYYGLPETQSFQVLYYRKDIMRELGLAIPQTWQDVYDMLPTLQQHEMNFYMDPQQFLPFISQNGVEFYTPDGFRTGLDTPEGFHAFKQWTDLYNMYAMEKQVPSFYQHFRTGTMPIGISDYNMYVQLAAAAPELNGRWGIALIPGVEKQDGTVSRWAGGLQTTGVIFQESKKKEQAWAFLKWWISTDTQVRYGSDLEAINGVSFRWNTANVEAFVRLPWKREDANVILQQWAWYKEKENPPGGYFMGRELNNAWVRSVIDGMNYRASLESAILDINRELRRKQQEFGFIDENGQPLKSLDFPVVKEPWDGVNPYVK